MIPSTIAEDDGVRRRRAWVGRAERGRRRSRKRRGGERTADRRRPGRYHATRPRKRPRTAPTTCVEGEPLARVGRRQRARRLPPRVVAQAARWRRATSPRRRPPSQRAPVSPSRTTSGSPPARAPITGTPVASASSALRPNDSLCVGSRKRSALASRGATASSFPRKNTRSCTPSCRASCSASMRSGPSPTMTSTLGISFVDARVDPDDVPHALHGAEVRDVHQHLASRPPGRGAAARSATGRRPSGR